MEGARDRFGLTAWMGWKAAADKRDRDCSPTMAMLLDLTRAKVQERTQAVGVIMQRVEGGLRYGKF